jgi:hypothetical protein
MMTWVPVAVLSWTAPAVPSVAPRLARLVVATLRACHSSQGNAREPGHTAVGLRAINPRVLLGSASCNAAGHGPDRDQL